MDIHTQLNRGGEFFASVVPHNIQTFLKITGCKLHAWRENRNIIPYEQPYEKLLLCTHIILQIACKVLSPSQERQNVLA
jgi:hypothetical protein